MLTINRTITVPTVGQPTQHHCTVYKATKLAFGAIFNYVQPRPDRLELRKQQFAIISSAFFLREKKRNTFITVISKLQPTRAGIIITCISPVIFSPPPLTWRIIRMVSVIVAVLRPAQIERDYSLYRQAVYGPLCN